MMAVTVNRLATGWGRICRVAPQGEGNLGERMARAFACAWREGFTRVVLVGADCPALSVEILQNAFLALADHDLVLGPATDGGYYLIGLTRSAPELFSNQPWGDGGLLAATLAVAAAFGLVIATFRGIGRC